MWFITKPILYFTTDRPLASTWRSCSPGAAVVRLSSAHDFTLAVKQVEYPPKSINPMAVLSSIARDMLDGCRHYPVPLRNRTLRPGHSCNFGPTSEGYPWLRRPIAATAAPR